MAFLVSFCSQMPSGQEKEGILVWLVEFNWEPFPKKRKKGATGQLGVDTPLVVLTGKPTAHPLALFWEVRP